MYLKQAKLELLLLKQLNIICIFIQLSLMHHLSRDSKHNVISYDGVSSQYSESTSDSPSFMTQMFLVKTFHFNNSTLKLTFLIWTFLVDSISNT